VYTGRPKVSAPLRITTNRASSSEAPIHQQQPPIPDNPAPSDLDLFIALRKVKWSTTAHPIAHFVSYDHLTPYFHQFALSISSASIPKTYQKVIMHPSWKQAMDEKMDALLSRGTWDLVTVPSRFDILGADGCSQWSTDLMVQWRM